jgi:hypothetical protein
MPVYNAVPAIHLQCMSKYNLHGASTMALILVCAPNNVFSQLKIYVIFSRTPKNLRSESINGLVLMATQNN